MVLLHSRMDKSFYEKFPCCFRIALESGNVTFESEPVVQYSEFSAYRGIFREPGDTYTDINLSDFYSQAEKGKKYNPRQGPKDSFYSCSTFLKIDECAKALAFPNDKNDRKIALGPINAVNGCIRVRESDGHVDWWLYDSPKEFWKLFTIVV